MSLIEEDGSSPPATKTTELDPEQRFWPDTRAFVMLLTSPLLGLGVANDS
jgi:hypothetical protein